QPEFWSIRRTRTWISVLAVVTTWTAYSSGQFLFWFTDWRGWTSTTAGVAVVRLRPLMTTSISCDELGGTVTLVAVTFPSPGTAPCTAAPVACGSGAETRTSCACTVALA